MKRFASIKFILSVLLICGACVRQEFKPPMSFFSLHGKSQADIEAIYGQPVKTETAKDTGNPVNHYKVFDAAFLRVEYWDGKADTFYFDIPYEWQTKNPEETLKRCGLDLNVNDAETDIHGLSWRDKSNDKLKTIIRINRIGDGDYYNCEAHFLRSRLLL